MLKNIDLVSSIVHLSKPMAVEAFREVWVGVMVLWYCGEAVPWSRLPLGKIFCIVGILLVVDVDGLFAKFEEGIITSCICFDGLVVVLSFAFGIAFSFKCIEEAFVFTVVFRYNQAWKVIDILDYRGNHFPLHVLVTLELYWLIFVFDNNKAPFLVVSLVEGASGLWTVLSFRSKGFGY